MCTYMYVCICIYTYVYNRYIYNILQVLTIFVGYSKIHKNLTVISCFSVIKLCYTSNYVCYAKIKFMLLKSLFVKATGNTDRFGFFYVTLIRFHSLLIRNVDNHC